MTETILPPDVLANLDPAWVVPLVGLLTHESNTRDSSGIYEVGAGHVSKIRWERSQGVLLRADASLTPGAVLSQWHRISDFSNAEHPTGPVDYLKLLKVSGTLKPLENPPEVNFNGRVVLITGAGAG